MGRKRKSTRRSPQARPRGILEVAPDGFCFVSTAEGEFFIPASKMGGAFDGDLVEIAPAKVNTSQQKTSSSGAKKQIGLRPTARVLRVINRAHDTIIGRYEVADPFGVVVPDDPRIPFDIFTMRSDNPDIKHGSIVRVRMIEYPSRNTAATGHIEEVLGLEGEPGMDIEAIIARHKLETKFSDAALAEAKQLQVDAEAALAEGYADERDRFVFTIDPFDARDFDDAISVAAVLPNGGLADAAIQSGGTLGPTTARPVPKCGHIAESGPTALAGLDFAGSSTASGSTMLENSGTKQWRIGIHIADVSHYVSWSSAVDADARKRATSVYLVDRVIPMLPEALSNNVCSLVPGQPRRVMTLDVVVDENANIYSVDCHLSLIESKARLSYDQAQLYIDAHRVGHDWHEAAAHMAQEPTPQGALPVDTAAHEQIYDALAVLHRFAQSRIKAREAAGGIDFSTTEAKVQLDELGQPVSVSLRKRTDATSCVEEAMILANECVARRLQQTQTPALFRVHEAPSADALSALIPVLQEFGYDKHLSLEDFVAGKPQALQELLALSRGKAEAPLVTNLLLRAQQRAHYSAECLGHYGLASASYCHFTSPIRRYPDLVVHRMLRTQLLGKRETYTQEVDSLPWLAEHSSKMERIAETAAR